MKNNLVLIKELPPIYRSGNKKTIKGLYECSCGNIVLKEIYLVNTNKTTQCIDCTRKISKEKSIRWNPQKKKLYAKWSDMKKRCYNPNVDRYNSYGALGITVCDEWKDSFINFYNWSISNGWSENLTIERKDVSKNYCPENCCYIPYSEQKYNLRNTFWIYYKSKKISLKKIFNESTTNLNVTFGTVFNGIKKGKSLDYYLNKYPNLKVELDLYILKSNGKETN